MHLKTGPHIFISYFNEDLAHMADHSKNKARHHNECSSLRMYNLIVYRNLNRLIVCLLENG